MENPIKMGWFGGTTIFGNIHVFGRFVDQTWGEVKTIGGQTKDGKMGRWFALWTNKNGALVN